MRGRAGDGSEEKRVGASTVRPLSRGVRSAAASKHGRMRRALVLLVAGVWLALAGLALSGAAMGVSAAPFSALATNTPTATPTTPPASPSASSTSTGTPTSIASPSATATRPPRSTPTTAPTAVPPTPTSAGDIGPQPTKVVSQLPSADGGGGGPLGGLSAGAVGSNGLLLATTSSCIVGLLGLLIAAIALVVLLRGGYGPFLKALLRGKRTGEKNGKRAAKGDLAAVGANSASSRHGFGAERAERGGGRSDPRGSHGDGGARQGSRAPSRSRSRGANHGGW